ncbi:LysR family transcriptional activator of glutamate synthase operon [Scopulibacillus darangshiensis]|uniref:LysR family transcriptional activator of glutamate synthase operon n=1 Tax=Scopulibacillus darangshiensis TaxID=442528 RepID=A0A4R2NKY9_9BACL|nr:LysR family transcriptional regulator [Scopulibacillus darangshiensis]TCP21925.1 LysR family transcriptional activator of glutamate synthase operon [Scopulibacillus darangshiensis]
MELRQILYFIEVAKFEHVTRAAETLHVAQSAISRQISLLEDELGINLFTREGRNVKLTQMGKLFMEHAERALGELDKAKQQIEEHLNPETGVIKLGLSTSLSIETLPMVLSQFRAEHPSIHFQLQQGTIPFLIRLIENGEIDIAFAAPVPVDHAVVDGHIFFSEKMLTLLPRDHPFSEQSWISLKQLKSERFVTFRPGLSLQEVVLKACQQAGFKPKIAFQGDDMDTIKGLVAAGFGVALIPEHVSARNLPPDVVTIPIRDPEVSRSVGVITPKNRKLAPSEQIFYQFIESFYDRLYQFGQ